MGGFGGACLVLAIGSGAPSRVGEPVVATPAHELKERRGGSLTGCEGFNVSWRGKWGIGVAQYWLGLVLVSGCARAGLEG